MVALSENFEGGLPAGWQAQESTDGGKWTVGTSTIGFFANPGTGNWVVINDEQGDKAGTAALTTETLDLTVLSAYIALNFDLNFQSYGGAGEFRVDILQGAQWFEVMRIAEDFVGQVSIDLVVDQREAFQVRFVYDDGDIWNWGAGIDNFELLAMPDLRKNGICDVGETPENCPGDCEKLKQPSAYWVEAEQDVQGDPVSFRTFDGGTICDDCSEEIDLGFEFNIYGELFSSVFINTNGSLTFGESFHTFTPTPFCMPGPKVIAPFFSDVDLNTGGRISWYRDPEQHYLIVNWQEVGYYGCEADCELRNTYQVILTDGSVLRVAGRRIPIGATVLISYGEMQWSGGTASGASRGLGGVAATVGMNRGDGYTCLDYGTFDHEGFDYYGNTQEDACPPNGLSHLDFRSLCYEGMTGQLADLADTSSQVSPAPEIQLASYTFQDSFFIEKIGPNPFRNSFVLIYHAPEEAEVDYLLTDMAGRTLRQGRELVFPGSNTLPFSLPNLAQGTYVLSLRAGGGSSFRYVVKQ